METCNSRISVAVLISAFITSGCSYSGDGEFKTEGFWPFINYSLELPRFPIEDGYSTEYTLDGYSSHGRSMLELQINSLAPIPFHELDAVVELKVSDELGTTYFYRKGSLNQHYVRMTQQEESSWALETEWDTRYSYGDPSIDERAVPFVSGKSPKQDTSAKYRHFMPSGDRIHKLTVSVTGVPEEYQELFASVNLRSSWK